MIRTLLYGKAKPNKILALVTFITLKFIHLAK
jgi:hypothetical protein